MNNVITLADRNPAANLKQHRAELITRWEALENRDFLIFIDKGELLEAAKSHPEWPNAGFSSFDLLCEEFFHINQRLGYYLISACFAYKNLCTMVQRKKQRKQAVTLLLPNNERQLRPLLPLKTPEDQYTAWSRAVEASGGRPTARHVQSEADRISAAQQQADRQRQQAEIAELFRPKTPEEVRQVEDIHRKTEALALQMDQSRQAADQRAAAYHADPDNQARKTIVIAQDALCRLRELQWAGDSEYRAALLARLQDPAFRELWRSTVAAVRAIDPTLD